MEIFRTHRWRGLLAPIGWLTVGSLTNQAAAPDVGVGCCLVCQALNSYQIKASSDQSGAT